MYLVDKCFIIFYTSSLWSNFKVFSLSTLKISLKNITMKMILKNLFDHYEYNVSCFQVSDPYIMMQNDEPAWMCNQKQVKLSIISSLQVLAYWPFVGHLKTMVIRLLWIKHISHVLISLYNFIFPLSVFVLFFSQSSLIMVNFSTHHGSTASTVKCLNNAVQFIAILHTALHWQQQNINQTWNSQQTPHSSPWPVSYGVSVVRKWRKLTAL